MKILVDVMGADRPEDIVKGALSAEISSGYSIVLYGDEKLIKDAVSTFEPKVPYEIVATTEVVSNDESPTMAFKTKKDSSLRRAFEDLSGLEDAVGLVSAGSTGGILTAGTLLTGRIQGVMRPTLCPVMPTLDDGCCVIADAGANVDAKPEWLAQFAFMASVYYKNVYHKESPRVALLNVGVEEHKGNNLTHAAFPLIKAMDLNFIGNIEARDALSGVCDVIIADGFDGNILIKSTEGAVSMVIQLLKKSIKSSFSAIIGSLFMKKAFKKLKKSMDINNYGGAPLLGVKKPVIKTHGSSRPGSVSESVKGIVAMHESGIVKIIEEAFGE